MRFEWSVVIAIIALAFSVSTFFTTRWRDRRDLFLRIHERLASVEMQEGRRLIHQLLKDQHKSVADLEPEQYAVINQALSNMNVACFYYHRGYIRGVDMLDQWAQSLVAVYDAAAPFLAYRDAEIGRRIWPELRAFVKDAREHRPEGLLRGSRATLVPRRHQQASVNETTSAHSAEVTGEQGDGVS